MCGVDLGGSRQQLGLTIIPSPAARQKRIHKLMTHENHQEYSGDWYQIFQPRPDNRGLGYEAGFSVVR